MSSPKAATKVAQAVHCTTLRAIHTHDDGNVTHLKLCNAKVLKLTSLPRSPVLSAE